MLNYDDVIGTLDMVLHHRDLSHFIFLNELADAVDYFSMPPRIQTSVENKHIKKLTKEDRAALGCVCNSVKVLGLCKHPRKPCVTCVVTTLFGHIHSRGDEFAVMSKDKTTTFAWFKMGQKHRENDLPAVVWKSKDGKIHRSEWYLRDQVARMDSSLPCIVCSDTCETECDICHVHYSSGSYDDYDEMDEENDYKNFCSSSMMVWFKNGLIHRDNDLPAYTFGSSENLVNENRESVDYWSKMWYKEGQLHRENDLPAIKNVEGEFYYLNGKSIRSIYYNANDGDDDHSVFDLTGDDVDDVAIVSN